MVAADWPYYLINICDVKGIVIHGGHVRGRYSLPRDVAHHANPVPILIHRACDDLAVPLKADSDRAINVKPALRLRGDIRPNLGAAYDAPAHPSWYTMSVDAHSNVRFLLLLLKLTPAQYPMPWRPTKLLETTVSDPQSA